MARRLRKTWEGQEMVGLYLPPSVGGALANLAALLSGKVPVNLNYTLSAGGQTSCSKQCGLKTVLTSRKFLEKVKLTVPAKVVFLEDVIAAPRVVEKLLAAFLAHAVPVRILERGLGRKHPGSLDDLATVIFSSGSTGDPKGVMLSHFNIMSNVEQLEQLFAVDSRDRFLGILPFFHSFGFTGTFCLPLVVGTGTAYHPNPLDAPGIGQLVRKHALTFMVATPTFLQIFIRGCEPEDFGSLRFVVAGAEKLPERLAVAFEDRFGIRPLEGYGCTECAPAVAINTRDFRAAGFRQVGSKRGHIGHPLPGMSVRIVDETTYDPRPLGDPGLMLVRGPNVMTGYLGREEQTGQVMRDGWYITGDMASMDEDGFLKIEGRLSRFSKIGGEMVPHVRVEDALHELAGKTGQTFVVTGVPDAKKGERLVVLHPLPEAELKACIEKLSTTDLPNLWKPRADAFFHQEQLPYLGSGKLDLKAVGEVARQLAGGSE